MQPHTLIFLVVRIYHRQQWRNLRPVPQKKSAGGQKFRAVSLLRSRICRYMYIYKIGGRSYSVLVMYLYFRTYPGTKKYMYKF